VFSVSKEKRFFFNILVPSYCTNYSSTLFIMRYYLSLLFVIVFISSTPEPKKGSESGNRFAFLLLKTVTEESKNNNFVLSPYSVRSCFSYVYAATASNTKSQIQNVMSFENAPEKELKNFQKSDSLFQSCKESKVTVANSMWVRKEFPIKSNYQKLAEKYTNSVHRLENAKLMNQWVSTNTAGAIKELVKEEDVVQAHLFLLNAVTMDALWKYPFSDSETSQGVFFVRGKKTMVPTMFSAVGGKYHETDSMKIVQLPYTDALRMTIFMPKGEMKPLVWNTEMQTRLIESNTGLDFNVWSDERRFYLHFPKFKVASTFNFVPTLKQMGIRDAFLEETANFSVLSDMSRLCVRVVKQKAVIEVIESGTKAAAATAVSIVERGAPSIYGIDKPFYFVIHHSKTGEILFMGRIMDPVQIE
jgi:serpin B